MKKYPSARAVIIASKHISRLKYCLLFYIGRNINGNAGALVNCTFYTDFAL